MSDQNPRVVDDVFFYTTKAGHQIEIDLDIPPNVFSKAMAPDAVTEEDQFKPVAAWLSKDVQSAYEVMGALERTRFLKSFFGFFQRAAGLPLGESFSSSPS